MSGADCDRKQIDWPLKLAGPISPASRFSSFSTCGRFPAIQKPEQEQRNPPTAPLRKKSNRKQDQPAEEGCRYCRYAAYVKAELYGIITNIPPP